MSNRPSNGLSHAHYEEALADHRRLVRELDVAINGDGAAKQASLCDVVAQLKAVVRERGCPILDLIEYGQAVNRKPCGCASTLDEKCTWLCEEHSYV